MLTTPTSATKGLSTGTVGARRATAASAAPRRHRAIVAGSTGAVGRFMVHHLARDPRVESVTAVTRRPRDDTDTMFFVEDAVSASKIKWAVVDYDALVDTGAGAELLAGHTIGMTGLGLYQPDARDEAHFRRAEIEYNVAVAKASGATRYAYLSSIGVKDGSRMMFARVKADAERAMREVEGMETSASMRPGLIMDRPDGLRSGMERMWTYLAMNWGLAERGFAVTCSQIARAMVQSVLVPAAEVQDVYENNDIRELSNQYDASFPSDKL